MKRRVLLALGGETREISLDLPDGEVPLEELMPVVYELADAIGAARAQAAAARGRPLTCTRGCAACCRQLVPVSEPERRWLVRSLRRLPAAAQERVQRRLQQVRALTDGFGITERLERLPADPRAIRAVARDYFLLGQACPMLGEDGACMVYEARPLVCREYAVSSPASACADPFGSEVTLVTSVASLAAVLALLLERGLGVPSRMRALALGVSDLRSEEPILVDGGFLVDSLLAVLAAALSEASATGEP